MAPKPIVSAWLRKLAIFRPEITRSVFEHPGKGGEILLTPNRVAVAL